MRLALPPFARAVAPAPRVRRGAALLWGTVRALRALLSFLETDERLEALKCAVYRRVPL